MHIQRLSGGRRRRLAPELVNQTLAGDDRARMQEEHSEERPLLRRAELHLGVGVEDLQRAENAEVHGAVVPRPRPRIKSAKSGSLLPLSPVVIETAHCPRVARIADTES